MIERDISPKLPGELDDLTEPVDFDWAGNSQLVPGDAVFIGHESSRSSYVFLCTSAQEGRSVNGHLYCYVSDLDELTLVKKIPARIRLTPPLQVPTSLNAKYLDFEIEDGDKKTNIRPVFDSVLVSHSTKLEEYVNKRCEEEQLDKQFSSEEARQTIRAVVAFLDRMAEENGDTAHSDSARLIASTLLGEQIIGFVPDN